MKFQKKNRLPCVKGAVDRSETEGLFLYFYHYFILTITIPPSLLRKPTSLYTRGGFAQYKSSAALLIFDYRVVFVIQKNGTHKGCRLDL
ncbi:MAG: hypothetical protein IJN25_08125 [Clostridia bacterium]|nr:hypothetical protein [Clostridia bacterium]